MFITHESQFKGKNASVEINGVITTSINQGLLVLLGVEENDDISDVQWLSQK